MRFDYDRYWSILQAARRPVLTPRRSRQINLRDWSWPLTRPYNGYAGVERVRGWQFTWWLKEAGVLAWPTTCDICGVAGASYHSEDYYCVFSAPALCRTCHRRVHTRFRDRSSWAEFVAANLARHNRFPVGSQPWFALLPCVEIDLASYVRERFGPSVRDLLNSPLYELPIAHLRPPTGLFLGDRSPPTFAG